MNLIEDLWDRIHLWLDKNVPEFQAYLRHGATDEEFQHFEEVTNVCLPEDFKTLYRIHNGSYGKPFFDCCYFHSLEEIAADWSRRKEDLESYHLNRNCELMDPESQSDVCRKIQFKWWDAYWIPFASSVAGDTLTLDLAPAKDGSYGQIFLWYQDFGSQLLASNLSEYLENFLTDLQKGRYDLRRMILVR